VTVMAHVSQPYVTVGRIIDLYICSLLAALRSLLHAFPFNCEGHFSSPKLPDSVWDKHSSAETRG